MPRIADSIHAMQVVRDTKSMIVTLNAVDRASEKIIRTDHYDWKKVHESCKGFASLYGVLGLLRDRNSGVQGVLNKLDAYKITFEETLLIGNLVKERAASGKRLSNLQADTLARYFSKKHKKTVSILDVTEKWSALSEEKKDAILAAPEVVKLMLAAAKAPRKADGVTFDDFI